MPQVQLPSDGDGSASQPFDAVRADGENEKASLRVSCRCGEHRASQSLWKLSLAMAPNAEYLLCCHVSNSPGQSAQNIHFGRDAACGFLTPLVSNVHDRRRAVRDGDACGFVLPPDGLGRPDSPSWASGLLVNDQRRGAAGDESLD